MLRISFKQPLVAAASLLAVAACADQWDVEGTRNMANQGDQFSSALHSEYVELAQLEADEGDWRDTSYFLDKAKMAAAGEKVEPDAMNSRDVPEHAMAELTQAREALMGVLLTGAPAANPTMAAKAQAGFDCWMQEQEEDFQPDDIAACKKMYMDAMDALKAPAPAPAPAPAAVPAMPLPAPFVVYFDFDSAKVDDMGGAVLADVAAAFKDYEGVRLSIAGHTDTSGSNAYNDALSQRRAEAVAKALDGAGVPAGVQSLEAFGESRLKVQTDDGVKERLNRRVEITFMR